MAALLAKKAALAIDDNMLWVEYQTLYRKQGRSPFDLPAIKKTEIQPRANSGLTDISFGKHFDKQNKLLMRKFDENIEALYDALNIEIKTNDETIAKSVRRGERKLKVRF